MPKAKKQKEVVVSDVEVAEKAPKTVKKDYTLEVRVNDVIFKTEAKNLKEALTDFINSKEFPFSFKTRTVIKYGKGDNVKLRIMPVVEARRIFNIISSKPMALDVLANKLTQTIG